MKNKFKLKAFLYNSWYVLFHLNNQHLGFQSENSSIFFSEYKAVSISRGSKGQWYE